MPVTRRPAHTLARLFVAMLAVSSISAGPTASAASTFGPQLPDNPYDGPTGTAAVHGDSGSSNTTPLPGPGARPVTAQSIALGAACSTIVVGSDGFPVSVCTPEGRRTSRAYLLDRNSGMVLASMAVTGVASAGYLDHAGRLVLVDGDHNLLRITHTRNKIGLWNLSVSESTPLGESLPSGSTVVGLAPAYNGKVWYTGDDGAVGIVDPSTRTVTSMSLPAGERVVAGISTAPQGSAVVTDRAVYLLSEGSAGTPVVRSRTPHGNGASAPAFFGPATGGEYLTLVDRAARAVVIKVSTGSVICTIPVSDSGITDSGSAPIGAGRTVIATGTDRMTRFDVRTDESGCDIKWNSTIRSAAQPRLSTADGFVTTITRSRDRYSYVAINATTGAVSCEQFLGATNGFDPDWNAGTVTPDRVLYQGTRSGIQRIS